MAFVGVVVAVNTIYDVWVAEFFKHEQLLLLIDESVGIQLFLGGEVLASRSVLHKQNLSEATLAEDSLFFILLRVLFKRATKDFFDCVFAFLSVLDVALDEGVL